MDQIERIVRKGRRVKTVERLIALAEQKRCVVHRNWKNPCPAAMVVHMPTIMVHRMLKFGMWEYKARKRDANSFHHVRK